VAIVHASEIERVFRDEYGRAVSVLVRVFGDIDLAEEAVQDAFAAAIERWPRDGMPPSPARWIIATARNRSIDRLRHDARRVQKTDLDRAHEGDRSKSTENLQDGFDGSSDDVVGRELAQRVQFDGTPDPLRRSRLDGSLDSPEPGRPSERAPHFDDDTVFDESEDPMRDDRLRLIFLCCHPALAADARVAMTLRLVGGLTTPEIARAFLVPEPTMAQRLVRAKAKVRDAGIPYRVPDESVLPTRIQAVLAVVYLIFNEGYAASTGDRLVRDDLCREAIRLGRLLADLMPDDAEVLGLLALMLLIESRRATRTTAEGDLVLLADQDRALWNRELIAEGHAIVRRCLRVDRPGPYQIQAAINAVHCDAPTAEETDWRQIVQLYDQLMSIAPSPVVALHRAVAVAEIDGAEAALAIVDELPLENHHMLHAIRAELLRRLGRNAEAATAYDAAIELSSNSKEREFLQRKRRSVVGG
jgi:RNA polymerase sigma-70 factor (ECF subfamily)